MVTFLENEMYVHFFNGGSIHHGTIKKHRIVTHMLTLTVQAVMIFNLIQQTKFENHSLAVIRQLLPTGIQRISPLRWHAHPPKVYSTPEGRGKKTTAHLGRRRAG
jgi:hypothetical protein